MEEKINGSNNVYNDTQLLMKLLDVIKDLREENKRLINEIIKLKQGA